MTLEQILTVLGAPDRFQIAPWSDSRGDDCSAIQGRDHVLYPDPVTKKWTVQGFTTWNDPEVGLFGQTEPGPVLIETKDVAKALKDFAWRCAEAEIDSRLSDLAEFLFSEENKGDA